MPPPYRHHVFVCTSDGEDCPGAKVLKAMRAAVKERGLRDVIRVQEAGCFDACDYEASVIAVYPEGVFYGQVALEDVNDIVEEHLVGGRPLDRRRIDFGRRTVGGKEVPPLPKAGGQ